MAINPVTIKFSKREAEYNWGAVDKRIKALGDSSQEKRVLELVRDKLSDGIVEASRWATSKPEPRRPGAPMTPEEFRAIRDDLGLTQNQLARILGYAHYNRVAEFESATSRRVIPFHLALVMEALSQGFKIRRSPPSEAVPAGTEA